MYVPFSADPVGTTLLQSRALPSTGAVTQPEDFGPLVELEQIGTRRCFNRDEEIFAQGDVGDCWYRVVSGTVRICKLLRDGRRHVAQFRFADDCFGLPAGGMRMESAEAIGDVVVTRYPQRATDRLIDENPRLARDLYDRMLRELSNAQRRTLLLGRLLASERVASFLVELSKRYDTCHILVLPMTRSDIADYLGLTIETVCRELSALKRYGIIASTSRRPDRIELRDCKALEALCEGEHPKGVPGYAPRWRTREEISA